MKRTKTPVIYEGELDELNRSYCYTVRGVETRKGADVLACIGFVGSLAWARKQARQKIRAGWRDVVIVGLPQANGVIV